MPLPSGPLSALRIVDLHGSIKGQPLYRGKQDHRYCDADTECQPTGNGSKEYASATDTENGPLSAQERRAKSARKWQDLR